MLLSSILNRLSAARLFSAQRVLAALVGLAFFVSGPPVLAANPLLQAGTALAPRQLEPADMAYVSPPTVNFRWSPTAGATQYHLLIIREGADDPAEHIRFQVSGTSYTASGLEPGYSYIWQVSANVPVSSYNNDFFEFTLSDQPIPPIAPSGIFASDGVSRFAVEIYWYSSYRTAYYLLQRRAPGSVDFVDLATLGRHREYTDEQAEEDLRYQYRVQACNSAGCSPPSPVDEGWITSCQMAPALPTPQLIAPANGAEFRFVWQASEYSLLWEEVPGADSYIVQLWDTATNNQLLREFVSGNGYYVDDKAGELAWNVTAISPVEGCPGSLTSETWTYTAIRNPPPAKPINVQASDGAYPDRIVISWVQPDSPPSPEETIVLRSTQPNLQLGQEIERIRVGEGSPYVDSEITPGTIYYYWIEVCTHADGCSTSDPDIGYASGEPLVLENSTFIPFLNR